MLTGCVRNWRRSEFMTLLSPKRDRGIWFMLKEYCRYRREVLFCYLLCSSTFALVQKLAGLPMDVVYCSLLLVPFVLGLWLVADGRRFVQQRQHLAAVKASLNDLQQELSEAGSGLERIYQE